MDAQKSLITATHNYFQKSAGFRHKMVFSMETIGDKHNILATTRTLKQCMGGGGGGGGGGGRLLWYGMVA